MPAPEVADAPISIHAPCTGSDKNPRLPKRLPRISIHAPCTGSDVCPHCRPLRRSPFQSTLPARGATKFHHTATFSAQNFNPRSLHGERRLRRCRGRNLLLISIHAPCTGSDDAAALVDADKQISIHAPCTGSDQTGSGHDQFLTDFNPRSLHGERRGAGRQEWAYFRRFQSTLPARGATTMYQRLRHSVRISIHAPCTGSDPEDYGTKWRCWEISIHAPCTGSDDKPHMRYTCLKKISIHAPCTGSDKNTAADTFYSSDFNPRSLHGERPCAHISGTARAYFNPRSLHGERLDALDKRIRVNLFQSTLPARGATGVHRRVRLDVAISIHAPCTGSDAAGDGQNAGAGISIHAPCTGSDMRYTPTMMLCSKPFQSTLPARGATHVAPYALHGCFDFNPRSLHGERPAH